MEAFACYHVIQIIIIFRFQSQTTCLTISLKLRPLQSSQLSVLSSKYGRTSQVRSSYYTCLHRTDASSFAVKQADELAPGECLVKMIATGVCHTDLHVKKGDWPIASIHPLVGGHEGVGTIVAIGKNTPVAENSVKIGDRVGIKWLAYSCLQCEFCRKGLEQGECSFFLISRAQRSSEHSLSECQIVWFHGQWHV